jgi:hypothetical protein
MSAIPPLLVDKQTSGEQTKNDATDPSLTSGLIACKVGLVPFLTRRSPKVLGFKRQDVRS